MILYCPHIDDQHGSFPHRVVIPVTTRVVTTRSRDAGTSREVRVVTGSEFVICALCDHWTIRLVDRCRCTCHNEARMVDWT